jgi:membrane-associated phospholipid phosphatase
MQYGMGKHHFSQISACRIAHIRSPRFALVGLILLTLCPGTSHAEPDQEPAFYSLEDWAPVQRWEYFAVPTALAATLGINLTGSPPSRWRGGILFDDWARNELELKSDAARSHAATASTVLLFAVGGLPFLVDAGLLTGLIHRRRDLAWQMFVMDAEALTLTGLITEATKRIAGRERPTGPGENDSFFSGHTSVAAAAATIVCLQHVQLQLLGNSAADAAVCGAAAAAALSTGLLRVMSDRHYASDVIAGAAAGAGSALLVYNLHARRTPVERTALRISPILRPGSLGLSFAAGF